jgi:hypothetical protein
MEVQTHVKAGSGGTGGGSNMQHNEAQVRLAGLKIQTGVKAGRVPCPPPTNGKGQGVPNC